MPVHPIGDTAQVGHALLNVIAAQGLLLRGNGYLLHELAGPVHAGDDFHKSSARLVRKVSAFFHFLDTLVHSGYGLLGFLLNVPNQPFDLFSRFR